MGRRADGRAGGRAKGRARTGQARRAATMRTRGETGRKDCGGRRRGRAGGRACGSTDEGGLAGGGQVASGRVANCAAGVFGFHRRSQHGPPPVEGSNACGWRPLARRLGATDAPVCAGGLMDFHICFTKHNNTSLPLSHGGSGAMSGPIWKRPGTDPVPIRRRNAPRPHLPPLKLAIARKSPSPPHAAGAWDNTSTAAPSSTPAQAKPWRILAATVAEGPQRRYLRTTASKPSMQRGSLEAATDANRKRLGVGIYRSRDLSTWFAREFDRYTDRCIHARIHTYSGTELFP